MNEIEKKLRNTRIIAVIALSLAIASLPLWWLVIQLFKVCIGLKEIVGIGFGLQ